MLGKSGVILLFLMVLLFIASTTYIMAAGDIDVGGDVYVGGAISWWQWSLFIFLLSCFVGSISIVAGLGGALLFVTLASTLLPFNLDYARAGALIVSLMASLSAAPILLRKGLASFRLGAAMVFASSLPSIIGAYIGLTLPSYVVELILGSVIFGAFLLMVFSKEADFPLVSSGDRASDFFGLRGRYYDERLRRHIDWRIHRSIFGFFLFMLVGFISGIFGFGAGLLNVPVLNQVLGVPIKVAAATSILMITVTNTTTAWVYLTRGAEIVLIAAPAVIGIVIGTRVIGVKLLTISKPRTVRWFVAGFLGFAGLLFLSRGFGLIDW